MKLNGRTIPQNVRTFTLKREGEEDFVFKCQAVLSYDNFNKLCPEPTPPVKMLPGGEQQQNVEDPKYKEALAERNKKLGSWVFINSLQATEGIEFETVKLDDPDTWANLDDELSKSGLTVSERARLYETINEAQGLTESLISEERNSFLPGREEGSKNA